MKINNKFKSMKRIVLLMAIVVGLGSSAMAQTPKFGYVNSAELMSQMPEIQTVQSELQKEAARLEAELATKSQEFQNKYVELQGIDPESISETEMEFKIGELQDLERRIQEFQVSGQKKIEAKEEELMAPIVEKVNNAIKAVSEEKGYTFVLDASAGILLYAQDSDNILELVKAKL